MKVAYKLELVSSSPPKGLEHQLKAAWAERFSQGLDLRALINRACSSKAPPLLGEVT